jgi:coatomer protein complex subunit epsilon
MPRVVSSMMDPDELYTLRNQFWLGNYQQAVNEGNSLTRLPTGLQVEKQEYMYRSFLALGQFDVVDGEIQDGDASPLSLRAVKVLSAYLQGNTDGALAQVNAWGSESNPTVELVCSLVHMHEGNIKDAMKSVARGQTMEQRSMMISLLLRMDRPDLAQKKYAEMRAIDEDRY